MNWRTQMSSTTTKTKPIAPTPVNSADTIASSTVGATAQATEASNSVPVNPTAAKPTKRREKKADKAAKTAETNTGNASIAPDHQQGKPAADATLQLINGGGGLNATDISLDALKETIRSACTQDANAISKALGEAKAIKETLRDGYPTTVQAGQAILTGVIRLKALPENQVIEYVETLTTVNSVGTIRRIKFTKSAERNLAIPLAQFGYSGSAVSAGHISRVSTVSGYAHYRGVTPETFPAFLTGEHHHSMGKGNGLSHAYQAAREFFSPDTETAAEKAARVRATALGRIKAAPALASVTVSLSVSPSSDNLYCLLARVGAQSGAVEIVTAVKNSQGKLIDHLLDVYADQISLSDKEAKAKTLAGNEKVPTFHDIVKFGKPATDKNN